jgi:Tfp pilus assembly protein PilF
MKAAAIALLAALSLPGCGGGPRRADGQGPPPEAMKAYTDAALLAKAGRLIDAAERYDEATRLDPAAAELWLAAARVRARLSQWDEAVRRAERALQIAPDNAEVRDELARIYVAAHRPADARAVYERRLQADAKDAAAWAGLGGLQLAMGEVDAAADALSRSVELDSKQPEAWERLGHARLQSGAQLPAAQAYDHAVQLDPDREHLDRLVLPLAVEGGDTALARRAAERLAGPQAAPGTGSLALAQLMLERDDLLGAANELEWLLGQHPDLPKAQLMLGQVLARVGRDDEAREHLQRIPTGDPLRGDAARLMGYLAMRADKWDDAAALLREAAQARPDDPDVALDVARVQRHQGDPAGARKTVTEALARSPRHAELLYFDALLRFDAGDAAGAMTGMQKVIAVQPDHAGALNFIGFSWAERGERLSEAEEMLRRAVEAKPDDGAIADSLGWVLFKQGRLDEAEKVLRHALELAPKEAEIHYHLGEVLLGQGKRADGLAAFDEAVKLAGEDAERRKYEKRRAAARKHK